MLNLVFWITSNEEMVIERYALRIETWVNCTEKDLTTDSRAEFNE